MRVDFAATDAQVLAPERGFYGAGIDLFSNDDFTSVRAEGHTLAYAPIHLDAYRTQALPASLIAQLDASLTRVRDAGIKLVTRIVYNDPDSYPCTDPSPTGSCADAAESVVLGHLEQLTDTLHAHADVIATMQLGIIGLWGEGHGSTSGLDQDGPRGRITDALLAALPPTRTIQMRTPMMKAALGYASPLTEAQAFDGSRQSRIGHHNDCFLASDSDQGTYATPIAVWQDYVAQDARFVPLGGETCAVDPPRTDCASALAEMSRLHWSFLNPGYHPDVLAGWRSMTPPCYDEIDRRLGYRFTLLDVSHSDRVRPGGLLVVRVRLRNDGFAAMYNARPVELVFGDGASRRAARFAAVDPRAWAPGAEATFESRFRIPSNTREGTYRLALALPDAAPTLHDRALYAVPFANDGVWDAARGDNRITDTLHIDATAPGATDPNADAFVEVP